MWADLRDLSPSIIFNRFTILPILLQVEEIVKLLYN